MARLILACNSRSSKNFEMEKWHSEWCFVCVEGGRNAGLEHRFLLQCEALLS